MKGGVAGTRLEAGSLEIRRVEGGDGPMLAEFAAGLSPESRRRRFFMPGSAVIERWVATLVQADPRVHRAEALLCHDPFGTVTVGVAEVIRTGGDTGEFAAAIADAWQGLGAGTLLVRRLADRSLQMGIRHWRTDALADNRAIARLLETAGRWSRIEPYRVSSPRSIASGQRSGSSPDRLPGR